MKQDLEFSDNGYRFLCNARKLASNKSGFDGLHYFLKVSLNIGKDGFADKGRITSRQYSLGTWHKWDWSREAELDYNKKQEYLGWESPSKIQSKLKSRGITDINISKLEEGIISSCIEQYNCGVRWERKHKCDQDFEKRKAEFLVELDKLKKRFEVNFTLETDWTDYEDCEACINIVDKHFSDTLREDDVTDIITEYK